MPCLPSSTARRHPGPPTARLGCALASRFYGASDTQNHQLLAWCAPWLPGNPAPRHPGPLRLAWVAHWLPGSTVPRHPEPLMACLGCTFASRFWFYGTRRHPGPPGHALASQFYSATTPRTTNGCARGTPWLPSTAQRGIHPGLKEMR